MAHEELRKYIKSELKRGMSKEAVRDELLAAGWSPDEIVDGMKSVGATVSMQGGKAANVFVPEAAHQNEASRHDEPERSGGMGVLWRPKVVVRVSAAVIVLLLGVIVILYRSGGGEEDAASDGSAVSVNTGLQEKVQSLETEVAKLKTENKELQDALAPFVLIPGNTATSTPTQLPLMLRGTIIAREGRYVLITSRSTLFHLQNANIPAVLAALKPLAGKSAEIMGVHSPGSPIITVTHVNGFKVTD